ncbi:MAG: tetratricopeptide repeat protein, partial [Bacteroidota bacterium]
MSNSWLRKFPLLLGMCLLVTVGVAQETLSTKSKVARKHYETAKRLLSTKDLDGAVLALQRALEKDRAFTEAYMLLGRTHQDQGDHPRAVRQLRNALKLANDEYLNIYYMLAVSEVKTEEYAEAIAHLEQLDKFPDVRKSVRRKGRKLLSNARFAKEAIANPVPFEPINLGKGVNSSLDEYLPAVTVDGRTLNITRNTMTGNVAATGSRNQEDFFVSTHDGTAWGKAVNLGPPINTDRNEGAQSISPDGRLLVFTACNRPGGKGSCD